jgi:hypothetical protein
MEDLKRAIKDLEESVRHCYEETIPLSSDDFVTIILTDVSFIIELFSEISSTNTGVLTTR